MCINLNTVDSSNSFRILLGLWLRTQIIFFPIDNIHLNLLGYLWRCNFFLYFSLLIIFYLLVQIFNPFPLLFLFHGTERAFPWYCFLNNSNQYYLNCNSLFLTTLSILTKIYTNRKTFISERNNNCKQKILNYTRLLSA